MRVHRFAGRRLMAGALASVLWLGALTGCAKQQQEESGGLKISYQSEGVTVVDDQNALDEAVNKMREKVAEGSIGLKFKNQAVSKDGINFSCSIGNSSSNSYDMFITIFADAELTDQLYLSGLIRPGEKFEHITLDRALDVGTHVVYVAFTQVEPDLETIHAQTFITLEFIVKE